MKNDPPYPNSIKRLVIENYNNILTFLISYVRCLGVPDILIEDVAQETIYLLLEQIKKEKLDWLLNTDNPLYVLKFSVLDKLSKKAATKYCRKQNLKITITMPNEDIDSINIGESTNRINEINEIIKQLPEEEQEILNLYYVDRYSIMQIKEKLKLHSYSAVRQRLHRIRIKIRKLLAEPP